MSFGFQNMVFGPDPQLLLRAWRYSDLHTGVASALTGILNVNVCLRDAE